jgi:hypothetical protein
MGKGINSETPPECTEHPPYVTVYVAAGGW